MRRAVVLLALTSVLMAAGTPAEAGGNDHDRVARIDKPYDGFMPSSTELRGSTPAQAGLDPAPIDAALAAVDAWTRPSGATKPLYAGAVTLLANNGKVVTRTATGKALKYADGNGTELPADQQLPMRTDTIFDMASVSKLFTSIVVVQQVEAGRVDLDAPIATYVPEFAQQCEQNDPTVCTGGKEAVTVRQALVHTTGLPSWLPLWSARQTPAERIRMALTAKLGAAPGTRYLYSDLNLIALGEVVTRVTGKSLDQLVADGITKPLRMKDTGYNPDPKLLPRIAATEFYTNPPRGMTHGSVHDENAWSLGGVAGHAGVFSTADDMAKLAQALLNGGIYDHRRILSKESVQAMITDYNQAFPGRSHGLGFELDQRIFMNGLSGPRTAGHTGYTGTSLVIDFDSRSFVILLTNRVHPSRNWGSNQVTRRAVALGLALSLAVLPKHGKDAWFSGTVNATSATLTTAAPVPVPAAGAELDFDLFVDTENTDRLFLERSIDGTTWAPVPFAISDRGMVTQTDGSVAYSGNRRWVKAEAALPAGNHLIRWRYTTDADWSGRGVYVDGVRITAGDDLLLNAERHPESLVGTGWKLARR